MPRLTDRPMFLGRHVIVAAGHYLAAAAGCEMARQGGNAIDAAAAAGFVLSLVEPQENSPGGEVPMLIHSAREGKVFALSGVGWSPRAFTIDWCRGHGVDLIPGDGYLPACVPAVVGTWAEALARFGTMSMAQVLRPALELAEGGFPMYPALRRTIEGTAATFRGRYPTTCALYMPDGGIPATGELLRNADLACVLRALCRAEDRHAHKGRVAGIQAAADEFYRGEIARRIVDFIHASPVGDDTGAVREGLLDCEDFADWHATVEEPVRFNYRGLEVHKCPCWTQGPVFLQQLALLAGFDLRVMGLNSPDYVHTRLECARLAFADREAYYGDPAFDRTPFDVLLSESYNARRRELVGGRASLEVRPGDAGAGIPPWATFDVRGDNRRAMGLPPLDGARPAAKTGDTTHLDVVDAAGNMVAASPSGGWIMSSPVVAGAGFPLGTRGQMFYLNPARPNALAARKRPRATLTPTLATRDGVPCLAFGARGGDTQDQTTLQFLLAHVEFGLDIQEALDVPSFWAEDFPSSFYPRAAHPGLARMEGTFDATVIEAMRGYGHEVAVMDPLPLKMLAVSRDGHNGVLAGGCRTTGEQAYVVGW